jgi:hypothetical protein
MASGSAEENSLASKHTRRKKRVRHEVEEEEEYRESSSSDTTTTTTSSSDTTSDDEDAFDTIDVDFEFFDPEEGDFHGIKTLLTNYLDGEKFDSSNVIDEIMACPGSTVIKCGDEGNIIGIAAVLGSPMTHGGILDFLQKHCSEEVSSKLKSIKNLRLILHERLMNSPPQLAPPLMEAILVPEVQETEGTFVLLGRGYREQSGGGDVIFALPEYEFLYKAALCSCDFPVLNRGAGYDRKDDLRPVRCVALLDKASLAKACKDMDRVIRVE